MHTDVTTKNIIRVIQQRSSIGGTMSLTLEEVRQREKDAKKSERENGVLAQWYCCLGQALEKSGGAEPDFGFDDFQDAHWIINFEEEFIQSVIGDQLKEHDLALATLTVHGGLESAVRVYIGKPGEYDQYMR